MSGKYPVTKDHCPVCEELQENMDVSIIEKIFSSKVPKPKDLPVHNWYSFVHSYSPKFVGYEIEKKEIDSGKKVLDPFSGAGTTLVSCKMNGIESVGVDVVDFLVFSGKVKTTWNVDSEEFIETSKEIAKEVIEKKFTDDLETERPELMKESYLSDDPLAKLQSFKKEISKVNNDKIRNLLRLVLSSIVVPASNVSFGPNFGLRKAKETVNVVGMFKEKTNRIKEDLEEVQPLNGTEAYVKKGDTRKLSNVLKNQKFDHVITSPPYPQDHDYSRQTRLELVLLDYVEDTEDLRKLKKEMVRASTRGVYKEDDDYQYVKKFDEISSLVEEVKGRVEETGGTSGFEKIYHRVVGEYFGGMYRCLKEIYKVLKDGGTCAFLVGDSHAFKFTHIQTAELLGKLGLDVGFERYEKELWQDIGSTAHDYPVPEYILELYK
ncbi:hypothetical protein AKJ63_00310 [candidate division MSBL1 archaeon SCGC-AAA259D18]|uniref:site-specific DNA-methyltransferase (cytosine-N(4)-specific) n=1 Tax=candidate division MSBL1 archaeon SCGC-AAA259D18 TaxID=1698262 RepID=A0A133UCP6_9EURY|nr:hypothetical protein AKJ63_00310 [candidate division MSBL1 archaeon SCGC-AAA259D18]